MYGNIYNREPFSVTELNTFIKGLLESEPILSDIYVRGEISNFKAHSSGHMYFSLKDEGGVIKCVMFRSAASMLAFMPENGMKVNVRGRVSAFVRDGQYQLYAEAMEPDGIGSLYVAFEQLKAKLSAEGLFDEARQKPIPKIPLRVGVITSPTGAAFRDIINITGRRFPLAEIVLYPALVQGEGAAPSLIEGVSYFNDTSSCDVIIIGRGGGSIEDLWAFNDERLCRKIAESHIPVISAVGHETDFTICDFVSDKRAPTPSAAAEIAVPDTLELKRKFYNIISREEAVLNGRISTLRLRLEALSRSRALSKADNLIDDKRMRLLYLSEKLENALSSEIQGKRLSLARAVAKIDALNPLAVISRGYSAVFDSDGAVVKSVSQLSYDDTVALKLSDGEAKAKIIETKGNNI